MILYDERKLYKICSATDTSIPPIACTVHPMQWKLCEGCHRGRPRVPHIHGTRSLTDGRSASDKDSSMRPEDVDAYLAEVRTLAKKYQGIIEIHAGFELDYLEGKEPETRAFLEKYPETVPHSILSVHFVQLAPEEYFCIDLDRESFTQKGAEIGYETLYTLYEAAVKKACSIPVRRIDPEKIGHINLIHKFQKAYSVSSPIDWKFSVG